MKRSLTMIIRDNREYSDDACRMHKEMEEEERVAQHLRQPLSRDTLGNFQ